MKISCQFFLLSDVLHVGYYVIWKDSHFRRIDLWQVKPCRDERRVLVGSVPMRQKRLSESRVWEFWWVVSRMHRKRTFVVGFSPRKEQEPFWHPRFQAPCRCRSRNGRHRHSAQRSRDPVQAADGLIWWAGQCGKLIGSINPATGEMKEYPLPANAMPHTVEIDARGSIWGTGKTRTVRSGYLDPQTGELTEVYKMPDPQAKVSHTR